MNQGDLVVIDTHALLWYLEESRKLSAHARRAFQTIEGGLSIVLAELMHISERGKTPVNLAEAISTLGANPGFRIVPFDVGIVIRMQNIPMFELHDRIIVATALSLGARLITKDEAMRDSGTV